MDTPANGDLVEGNEEDELREQAVSVSAGDVELEGTLTLPAKARGIVVFAHGSGSSRLSARNIHVAQTLNKRGLGTLLFDLLTADEDAIDRRTRAFRFDIELMASRVISAMDWLLAERSRAELNVGLFGASTGAAAALVAAALRPNVVRAVVSRGGRPDLAGALLEKVQAPTLLIVGGNDAPVIRMNREAYDRLTCTKHIEIVPGASHLFEEPGTLEDVASLACGWFAQYLN